MSFQDRDTVSSLVIITFSSMSSKTSAGLSGNWYRCSSSPGEREAALVVRRRCLRRFSSSATASNRSTDFEMLIRRCSRMPLTRLRTCGNTATLNGQSSTVFRAVPELLRFVNDLFTDVEKSTARHDAFRYEKGDRFPLELSATEGQCNPTTWRCLSVWQLART